MRLNFYKPNKSNTGTALSFNVVSRQTKEAPENGLDLYVSFVKQASWNESTRKGSFSENAKNPEKTASLKLNETEAATIIRAVRLGMKFSTVHAYQGSTTSIMFGPYQKKNGDNAFSFSIKKGEQSFLIGFELGEGELIAQFFENYLAKSFDLAE
jgi:hypothetical protein